MHPRLVSFHVILFSSFSLFIAYPSLSKDLEDHLSETLLLFLSLTFSEREKDWIVLFCVTFPHVSPPLKFMVKTHLQGQHSHVKRITFSLDFQSGTFITLCHRTKEEAASAAGGLLKRIDSSGQICALFSLSFVFLPAFFPFRGWLHR